MLSVVLWKAAIHLGPTLPRITPTPNPFFQLHIQLDLASFTQPFRMLLPVFMGFHWAFICGNSNGSNGSYIPFINIFHSLILPLSHSYTYLSLYLALTILPFAFICL